MNLKQIGTILYRCEGSKYDNGMIEIINSDPEIIKTFYKFLIDILQANPKRIVLRLMLHEDVNEDVAKVYWSSIVNNSNIRFNKTIIKKPNQNKYRRKTLLYGMCCIRYSSREKFYVLLNMCKECLRP